MAHNRNCAQAQRPGCECECGGARHGCQGAFEVADAPEDVVWAYVAEREKEWRTRPSGISLGQAAIGCARADVVHWLHRDCELRKCARTAEEKAFEDSRDSSDRGLVLRGLTEHLGPERMQDFQRWAGGTHFWCELLAQIACALAQYERLQNRICTVVEDVLSARDVSALPDDLHRTGVIGFAVRSTWRYVLEGVIAASGIALPTLLTRGGPLIWSIRVMAVLMCPDASCHPAVRGHCWEPIVRLGSAEVRQVVRERLIHVFLDDPWFAQGGNFLGGT